MTYTDLVPFRRRKWRPGCKPYRRESIETRRNKSIAAKARQERDRIMRAAGVALIAATLALGGCVTTQAEAPPLTSGEALARAQRDIIAANGKAGPDVMIRYARALAASGEWRACAEAANSAIDPSQIDASALNLEAACTAEAGDIVLARAMFGDAAKLGDQAAAQNLAKLEPPKVPATSTPKRAAKRTGGRPRAAKNAPLRLIEPDANGSPTQRVKVKWLERPL